jgi:hypothetical protein
MLLSVNTFLEISLDYKVIKCDILFYLEFNMKSKSSPNLLNEYCFSLMENFRCVFIDTVTCVYGVMVVSCINIVFLFHN